MNVRQGWSTMNTGYGKQAIRVLFLAILLTLALPAAAEPDVDVLLRQGEVPIPCLTPMTQSLHQAGQAGGRAARSAMAAMRPDLPSDPDRYRSMGDGIRILMPEPDRVPLSTKLESDIRHLERVLSEMRLMLQEGYGIPAPDRLTLVFAPVRSGTSGYVVPMEDDSGLVIVLNYPARIIPLTRAAVHQYAHAATLTGSSPVPSGWAEAFATWAGIRRTGRPNSLEKTILEYRRDHLQEGLDSRNLELAAGNALWFLYLDEAFGPEAVRLTVEELRKGPTAEALDRGVRRAAGYSLREAFRNFHLWSVLTGTRSTGQHLKFARALSEPVFPSSAESYPALSVHADPPVASLGATHVLLHSDDSNAGGLVIRFEGELNTDWEADILLERKDGVMHRVPVTMVDGSGEAILPLSGMHEAVLLIRNLDPQSADSQRYTWAAHRETAFPFELSTLEVHPAEQGPVGILVAWETESEQDLVGFNILRVPESGGTPVRINPIRVPAIGDMSSATSYQYMDRTAEQGRTYVYSLEGVTRDGLCSRTRPVTASIPSP